MESKYIICTPVKNEVKYIEATMQSVIKQTLQPLEWLIVSDQSDDGTDELVEKYSRDYPFIRLLKYKYDGESPLVSARKTYAARHGIAHCRHKSYQYFVGMDADVTFPPNFFEELQKRCEEDKNLGIVGGYIYNVFENGIGPYFNTPHSVGGPMQFFRRQCYEEIGGWQPVGMEDGLAVTSARMHGWKVKAYKDLRIMHHKPSGIKGRNIYKAKFNLGRLEFLNGDHPLYQAIRSFRYLFWRPYFVGSFIRIAGYWKALLNGEEVTTPEPLRGYLRKEQLQKLNIFRKIL
ncbi:MAG: glycosyltransferase family 2 protein [Cyclobacteriaceae bacterium]